MFANLRWLCAGATSLMLLNPGTLLAEDPPPKKEQTESVQKVAEDAAAAAKAIAAEAAAEAKQAAAKVAEQAAKQAREAANEVVKEVTRAADEAVKQARATVAQYELGIQAAPVPTALDAQLKLEGKGVLVDSVNKDSAAEQAGFKPHDIILSVAERDLASPRELAKAIAESKGQELKCDVLRAGEKLTITVQPRATEQDVLNLLLPKIDVDEELLKLESKVREKLKDAGVDVRMQVIRPGHILPSNVAINRGEVPDGVSISVRKEGGKPGQVEVTRGDETWKLSEAELDKLPDDLRPHVERMLGHGPLTIGFGPQVKMVAPLPPGFTFEVGIGRDAAPHAEAKESRAAGQTKRSEMEAITRNLHEIKKDIKRIYKQIDDLREDRKGD